MNVNDIKRILKNIIKDLDDTNLVEVIACGKNKYKVTSLKNGIVWQYKFYISSFPYTHCEHVTQCELTQIFDVCFTETLPLKNIVNKRILEFEMG